MSNMRKYVMTLLSATLRNEDLNLARTRRLLEQFQFAARQQQDMSADVTFTLHGSVVMFYHFDPSFFQKAILSKLVAHLFAHADSLINRWQQFS